ncbi:winged helix-turn-helix domain-containing protein [Actinopolymorpha alba]|uniref:ArsR/SmtB family transcription factor n=1 Tax=Actinopolymorpha alba TaxID=533267 RepID=UPI000A00C76E
MTCWTARRPRHGCPSACRSLGVSLGTVSAHLAVLRDSGVVTGARTGRSVFYRRTERGDALAMLLGAGLTEDHEPSYSSRRPY